MSCSHRTTLRRSSVSGGSIMSARPLEAANMGGAHRAGHREERGCLPEGGLSGADIQPVLHRFPIHGRGPFQPRIPSVDRGDKRGVSPRGEIPPGLGVRGDGGGVRRGSGSYSALCRRGGAELLLSAFPALRGGVGSEGRPYGRGHPFGAPHCGPSDRGEAQPECLRHRRGRDQRS